MTFCDWPVARFPGSLCYGGGSATGAWGPCSRAPRDGPLLHPPITVTEQGCPLLGLLGTTCTGSLSSCGLLSFLWGDPREQWQAAAAECVGGLCEHACLRACLRA